MVAYSLRHARAGETMQLYTGQRTRQCRLIGRAECVSVMPITLRFEAGAIDMPCGFQTGIEEIEAFARADGFAGWAEMKRFWREQHEVTERWSGMLIHWRNFIPASEAP